MRELFIGTCGQEDESGVTHRFKYYILTGEMQVNGGFACESYGVKIVDDDNQDEASSIPNITTSVSRIDELMELLTRNTVGPASLGDVVADWL